MTHRETQHIWRLEDIYSDASAWEDALSRLEQGIDEVGSFRGRLGEGPRTLLACLDAYFEVLKELYRASSYASMRYHEDTRVGETAAMEQQASLVSTRLFEQASFIEPEILALGTEQVERYLSLDPALATYRQRLHDILRRAEHTRSSSEEEIIAAAGLVTDAPSTGYGILANADAPWPTVKLSDGTEFLLNQAGFARYRGSAHRADRAEVFARFFGVWERFERTFGAMLYAQVKRDVFYARVRRYESSLEAALDPDRIPLVVYQTLVAQANEHLPVLHRYFGLRSRLLGVDELRYWDIYPPLATHDRQFPIERGKELVLDALEPLGPDMQRATQTGLAGRWMDVYPRPGKKAGAYMNGHVYDVHPFVLLNYNDDYESVSTLAHEWGHVLHSYMANRTQHFANADYSIFLAEIASTLNEALLLDRMLAEATEPDERLFYLGHALEQLRGTFFRQTMFAEFELSIHERVDGGEALTADRFREMYGELVRRYHGHELGVVRIDEAFTVEWAYIPHFYYNFYVYQYATAVAASSLLAERILSQEEGAVEAYLGLLEAGGSGYAADLLLQAGVDLGRPEPYEALMRRMGRIMDEIEVLVPERA
jgi:oligoendopeptidase F